MARPDARRSPCRCGCLRPRGCHARHHRHWNFFALPKLFRTGFVKLCPQRGLVRHQAIMVCSAPLIHSAAFKITALTIKNPRLFHERIDYLTGPCIQSQTQLGMDKSTRCTSLRPWIRFYCSSSAWPPSSAAFSGSDCTLYRPLYRRPTDRQHHPHATGNRGAQLGDNEQIKRKRSLPKRFPTSMRTTMRRLRPKPPPTQVRLPSTRSRLNLVLPAVKSASSSLSPA